jgi:hypothetical protein
MLWDDTLEALKEKQQLGAVAHICNPSNSRSRDLEDHG